MRRPIAHTCFCSLELPLMYVSYLNFEHELHAALSDDECNWQITTIEHDLSYSNHAMKLFMLKVIVII